MFAHLFSLSAIPTTTLNNGVVMPMISLGTWQYTPSVAKSTVELGLKVGFNHIDTANDYKNQKGVGEALAGIDRSSYFLTTKVPSQSDASTAFDQTTKDLNDDISELGLDFVDLMLIHFPPRGNTLHCKAMQESWRAMEAFYAANKTRAIGVSNYCISSFECILKTAKVVPAVNQVQYLIGMGSDPEKLFSYAKGKNVTMQAYSPLGDGTSELINGPLVSKIGAAHNKTGAQVSLHWVALKGVPLSTKSTSEAHLKGDLDIFDWSLSSSEVAELDAATTPKGNPSFMCTS